MGKIFSSNFLGPPNIVTIPLKIMCEKFGTNILIISWPSRHMKTEMMEIFENVFYVLRYLPFSHKTFYYNEYYSILYFFEADEHFLNYPLITIVLFKLVEII